MGGRSRIPPTMTLILTLLIYSALGFLLFRERPEQLPQNLAILVAILPHAIALVNTIALACLYLGYRSVKQGDISKHKIFMATAVVLILAFLIMYVTRISLGGVK